jgi:acyl-CoA reductase-like NAD-dependent aldehyde dehydrogenase
MELGGNDPFVVLKDADFDLALKKAVEGRTRNAGQVCTAPKRFIIEDELYDKFRDRLI